VEWRRKAWSKVKERGLVVVVVTMAGLWLWLRLVDS